MEIFDPPAGALVGATVVLFNGPPRCGKDTAGNYLHTITPRSRPMKFAGTLKRSVHMDFGLPYGLPDDAFEQCKDQPHPAFFGMTPREAYIQKSEQRQKPFLGPDIYGRCALRRVWRSYQEGIRVFYFTDSGFELEAWPIVHEIGEENTLLCRIHADKRGKTFAGDSRSHISMAGVRDYDLDNNDSIDDYTANLRHLILPFVSDRIYFR